ncbi:MAG: site-specific DNA-methyltransferase [Acidobacteria bacterium]|nr:MAG: site-specific DNA-methyltransferase [Acidobacteriota bacterium]
MHEQLRLLENPLSQESDQLEVPTGYRGLYAFHKYWGKKPHELMRFIVGLLTSPADLVLDPFVGSGTSAREALLHKRRFIGCDINPIACAITRLLSSPPRLETVTNGFAAVTGQVRDDILKTYRLEKGGGIASHYLWDGPVLKSVWQSNGLRMRRTELKPTDHDVSLMEIYKNYVNPLKFPHLFTNSRINAEAGLTVGDLFTGRALRNIDVLLSAIESLDADQRDALRLCLTAASGQMTNMVFAITNRGKTRGERALKVEVGSWVIGYWRPTVHFEINVWNCFARRVEKLIDALSTTDPLCGTKIAHFSNEVLSKKREAYVGCLDCRSLLASLPDQSVNLVVTDPPHSNRIPYLELSAMWNSLLGCPADFDHEIVVSEARARSKSVDAYTADIQGTLLQLSRVLKPHGAMVFLFNARNSSDWAALRPAMAINSSSAQLRYIGCFPAQYSTGSVVQDNRAGSLRHDYALVFSGSAGLSEARLTMLNKVQGWSYDLPPNSIAKTDT